ncbi:MAG: transposase [Gammaproteobacteria bacterium]|nr:transposase [Gammaproteobacteria bacterium]
MATRQSVLFSWDDVERLPELKRLSFVLDHLPDGDLVAALEAKRGRGRDEYPVAAMWRALVAGMVFGHDSSASLLRELGRNPALLALCGFDPLGRQSPPRRTLARRADGTAEAVCEPSPWRAGVPTPWAFSRFLSNVVSLEEKTGAVSAMVDALRRRLMDELPGFGRHLGYDGKALSSHSTGKRKAATGRTSDPDADWGRHETGGVDAKGKAWTKVKTWFGYGLHLVADAEHEIPVWFEVTKASASEHAALSAGVDDLFAKEPGMAARCEDFCADRGLDGGPLKRRLWDVWEVRPLTDVRELWREEKEMPGHDPSQPVRRSLAADGGGNVLHSGKGEVFCRCPATGEERPMAFQGFEADRGTLKYRCPAAAYGFDCAGRERCLADAGSKAGDYGRVVRVDLAGADRRMFTPTPWGSPSWKRGYARRSGLERINARLDGGFRFENHFVRGKARMKTRIGLAVAVMMALALGAVLAGRPERMRSLVDPGLPLAA